MMQMDSGIRIQFLAWKTGCAAALQGKGIQSCWGKLREGRRHEEKSQQKVHVRCLRPNKYCDSLMLYR